MREDARYGYREEKGNDFEQSRGNNITCKATIQKVHNTKSDGVWL